MPCQVVIEVFMDRVFPGAVKIVSLLIALDRLFVSLRFFLKIEFLMRMQVLEVRGGHLMATVM